LEHRMFNRTSRLAAACVLIIAGTAFSLPAEPPADSKAPPSAAATDADVKAALDAYSKKVSEAIKAKENVREAYAKAAGEALDSLNVETLTVDQFERLRPTVLSYAPKIDPAMARLAELSKDRGADGARAAVMRLTLIRQVKDAGAQKEIIHEALTHPGLATALQDGKATEVFSAVGSLPKEMQGEAAGALVKFDKVIPTDLKPEIAPRLATLMQGLAEGTGTTPEQREPLRQKCLAVIAGAAEKTAAKGEEIAKARSALKAGDETDEGKAAAKKIETDEKANAALARSLTNAKAYVDGAYVKGQLVDNHSPPIDFIWCSVQPAYKSIDDLKGKVVVVDFWATWCPPCMASIPKVREMVKRYEGYPVVFLGVTSIQGRHIDRSDPKSPKTIDTKGDPEKEVSLMPGFIKQMDITWPIVFSRQDVFNPDYGVRGIPHVAILDPKGTVRFRGMNPLTVVHAEECAMIDGLLKEAGLPTPPPPPAEEKKVDDKSGD